MISWIFAVYGHVNMRAHCSRIATASSTISTGAVVSPVSSFSGVISAAVAVRFKKCMPNAIVNVQSYRPPEQSLIGLQEMRERP